MKARKLILDDKAVYLRLSASKLAEYAASIGSGGNVLFSVMDALDDVSNQAALFDAALNYKGNPNENIDGYELIDMLADAQYGPLGIKQLIVELAEDAGIISKVDAAKLLAAIKTGNDKLYDAAVAVLSGDLSNLSVPAQETETQEENPT